MANNKLLKQLLENSQKLIEAYKRTKDESILTIVENMIQLMLEEVGKEEVSTSKTTWIEDLLKQAKELEIPIKRYPAPPWDGGVYIYAAPGVDRMGPAAYAAPPITVTGDAVIVSGTSTDPTATHPSLEDENIS